MVKKILLPQEVETFYVIPTIRKYMAVFMKEKGLKQKSIAKIFGIRDAAISQYLTKKRGNKIKFSPKILNEIKKSSNKVQNSTDMIREIQRIIKIIRKDKLLCRFCHSLGNAPKNCTPAIMGC